MFGKDFLFGISMSGFQFEMGRGEIDDRTDWFVWVRDTVNVASGLVSGELPENGPGYWELFEKDHDIMEKLGMNALRIGVEWSRIFPESTEKVEVDVERDDDAILSVKIDEESMKKLESMANSRAVKRYREIMEDIKKRDLHLIVDLNHFTLPIWLHDPREVRDKGIKNAERNGWYSVKSVIEFSKFAAFCAKIFGDLVDEWSTMNEPQVVSSLGYVLVNSGFPPAYPSFEAYVRTMINQAQAHARAYDLLKGISKKPVGIIYSFSPAYPIDEDSEGVVVSANYYQNFWFMDMITFGKIGKLFDGSESLEREDMKDKVDFIGVNYYTRIVVAKGGGPFGWRVVGGYGYGCEPNSVSEDGYPTSDFGWEVFPKGLYDTLKMLHERYSLEMMVTENGIADSNDSLRSNFIVAHVHEVERALGEGIPVRGYLHWSLVDNYEWAKGFSKRFGLVHVDFSSKERALRPSAIVYSHLIRERTTEGLIGSVPFSS